MKPKVQIMIEREQWSEEEKLRASQALASIEELSVTPLGEEMGLKEVGAKALEFVGELLGSSSKLADSLIELLTRELAGATVKLKVGTVEIEIINANRSQLIELFDRAIKRAEELSKL